MPKTICHVRSNSTTRIQLVEVTLRIKITHQGHNVPHGQVVTPGKESKSTSKARDTKKCRPQQQGSLSQQTLSTICRGNTNRQHYEKTQGSKQLSSGITTVPDNLVKRLLCAPSAARSRSMCAFMRRRKLTVSPR